MAGSVFQHYLNKLTDLSARNKSLYLPKTEGNAVIDLQELDFLNGEAAFEILRKIIQGKKKIPLIPVLDPRQGQINQLSKLLSKITFRDQLTREETGDESLFLTWPFVEGKMLNGQILRAPLLLLPCRLEKQEQNWVLVPTDSWQWNSAFLLSYSLGQQVDLDSETLENQLQDLPTDPIEFRLALVKMVESFFHIKLSSDFFEDRISSFPNSQVSVDNDKFKEGKLSLKTYALLGQFAQKGNFLFGDYEELNVRYPSASLEELLTDFFAQQSQMAAPREDQVFPVFPLDASQENVLLRVRQGKNLVVEGPPGTGKSQTISNLVSDFVARGKRVLVVSQKRAALDVVYERMAKAGFGEFLGLVHDFRADQNLLFQKIKSQIDAIETYQEENRGLDSMQLEREISLLSKTIIRISEKFENFRTALFESESAGIPIKAMYLNLDSVQTQPLESKSLFLALDYEAAQSFEKEFKVFSAYHLKFKDSFWNERVSFSAFQTEHFSKISELVLLLENYPLDLSSRHWNQDIIRDFYGKITSGESFVDQISKLIFRFENLKNKRLPLILTTFSSERKIAQDFGSWLKKSLNKIEKLSFSIPHDLEKLRIELDEIREIQASWLGRITLNFKENRFPHLISWMSENGLAFNSRNLEHSKNVLEEFLAIARQLQELKLPKGLPVSLDQLTEVDSILSESLEWVKLWDEIPQLALLRDWESLVEHPDEFRSELRSLLNFLRDFEKNLESWKVYLTASQIGMLLLDDKTVSHPNFLQTFSELVAFDQFLNSWSPQRILLAKKILGLNPDFEVEENIRFFWNSWYNAWIEELERRNPILAEAGSLKMKSEMAELKEAILEKRKIVRFKTLLRLREQLTESLEYNRLGNRVTYRDLLHQVSKKRQKWPVRKLVENFEDEIFRLIPCWLASPETVSALFPLAQTFDLVIFDEASQCPVERGLPAMLRGKQVVVAGDSRQLRPSDFYQVKWESEEEGIEYEAESLLELASNFFEKTTLIGHYRSADPGLIHFSNRHFYQNQLETLPDYSTMQKGKSPFSYQKVEGIWENQMNKTEADAVLSRVKSIQQTSPDDSIGIVTGNYFQMELIREKLWKEGFGSVGIKVRNIENVQGDEFDQVILSLGYAFNREGKLTTNFGLLGRSGAENRLNVAITRARKMLHVISSIDPEDFRPSQLNNPGLALFREFLSWTRSQSKERAIPALEATVPGFEIDWSLKNRLRAIDPSFSRKIPSTVMDLIRTRLEGTQAAVLTDDQRFFNAPTAKAAIAYHPILLEEKGWEWEWYWSREAIWNSRI